MPTDECVVARGDHLTLVGLLPLLAYDFPDWPSSGPYLSVMALPHSFLWFQGSAWWSHLFAE
jgi:hypothetical protein